jgi:ATP-dependent RNA helicase DeaD
MIQLTGIRHKGRQVRCNDADEKQRTGEASGMRSFSTKATSKGKASQKKVPQDFTKKRKNRDFIDEKDDWRSLMKRVPRDLRGPEPDFSEEGWALRKTRKKKK